MSTSSDTARETVSWGQVFNELGLAYLKLLEHAPVAVHLSFLVAFVLVVGMLLAAFVYLRRLRMRGPENLEGSVPARALIEVVEEANTTTESLTQLVTELTTVIAKQDDHMDKIVKSVESLNQSVTVLREALTNGSVRSCPKATHFGSPAGVT